MSMFWKVKEIVEENLEHFLALLDSAVEYEQNPSTLENFSHAIDLLVECRSLLVSIELAINSWEVLLSELKEKCTLIFPKKSS